MKHINLAITTVLLLFAFVVSGCGDKDGTGAGGSKSAEKKKLSLQEVVKNNISEMEKNRWDRAAYIEIRDKQIEPMKATMVVKKGLRSSLDMAYSKVLVKEGNIILDKCDANLHKRLGEVMDELKNPEYRKAEGIAALEARFKEHREMLAFVSSMYAKQSVKSIGTVYDKSFETNVRNKAQSLLAKNPTCAYIKSRLQNLDPIFRERREDYAKKLYKLYTDTDYKENDDKQKTDEKTVMNNISKAGVSTGKFSWVFF